MCAKPVWVLILKQCPGPLMGGGSLVGTKLIAGRKVCTSTALTSIAQAPLQAQAQAASAWCTRQE